MRNLKPRPKIHRPKQNPDKYCLDEKGKVTPVVKERIKKEKDWVQNEAWKEVAEEERIEEERRREKEERIEIRRKGGQRYN